MDDKEIGSSSNQKEYFEGGLDKESKDYTTKFPMPQLFAGDAGFMNIRSLNLPSPRQVLFHVWIISCTGNELAWKDDEEFWAPDACRN
uniref:Putative ovule protein n=1 Tax=Solanum chacoense TaxID=4108 RepID=A0A0V0HZN0_SOLCH